MTGASFKMTTWILRFAQDDGGVQDDTGAQDDGGAQALKSLGI